MEDVNAWNMSIIIYLPSPISLHIPQITVFILMGNCLLINYCLMNYFERMNPFQRAKN